MDVVGRDIAVIGDAGRARPDYPQAAASPLRTCCCTSIQRFAAPNRSRSRRARRKAAVRSHASSAVAIGPCRQPDKQISPAVCPSRSAHASFAWPFGARIRARLISKQRLRQPCSFSTSNVRCCPVSSGHFGAKDGLDTACRGCRYKWHCTIHRVVIRQRQRVHAQVGCACDQTPRVTKRRRAGCNKSGNAAPHSPCNPTNRTAAGAAR